MQPSSFTVFIIIIIIAARGYSHFHSPVTLSHVSLIYIKNKSKPVERFTPGSCLTTQFVLAVCFCFRRGLNPPHRVKSISMTTFSQQEVEFLQNHGNEVSGGSTST